VTSLHQATILAQSAGEVTRVYRKLGDAVSAGDIIAQFENSAQNASLIQAQGSYDAAQAGLLKTQNGGTNNQKDISAIQNANAQTSVANASSAAKQSISSAYSTIDDAVHNKTDPLFTNPNSVLTRFAPQTSNSQLTNNIENKRPLVEQKITDLSTLASSVSDSSDIDASLVRALADAQYIADFLNDVAQNMTYAIPTPSFSASVLSGYQTSINAGRSATVGAIAALNGAKSGYDAAVSGAQIAGKQLNDSSIGGRPEDVMLGNAQVKQALGSLYAARSSYEKTIIRSPLSGTIVSLPIKTGSYVTSFSPVAIVSNAHALEVVTAVTGDDAKALSVGGAVDIEGASPGVITSIAPALNPTTNKIEVRIGLRENAGLVDGESVSISLPRSRTNVTSTTASTSPLSIPIVSLKITPKGPIVFTLDPQSKLIPHDVTLGAILGDRVIIKSGLTSDMRIVTDARGLSVGETVQVIAP
jgi:multidrug efflux pump subunit AcrA (membrane-fusion protein)